MTQEHPLVTRYLSRLDGGLASLAEADRAEILSDIRSHIAEAVAAGAALEQVLTTLGPVDQLARAYAVELLLNPAPGRPAPSSLQRFLSLAGLLALTSLPTLVIVTTLGAVGVSLLFSGVVVFLAGIVDAFGVALPFADGRVTDVHPVVAVAIGPVLTLVGGAALWALSHYLRWLARTIRSTLPGR